ncbi:unnamed protein product [Diatraea saccharalis]|uniref:Uncharacterized protein n=1 Tax=Diatraea saccharalis TaxID=40085 RepID=A0A9N9N3A0_9NEOP|nr:unnamed protein product [Diatraea saccharalis]
MRSVLLAFVAVVLLGISVGEDAKPKNSLEDDVLSLLTKWRRGERGPFSFPLPSLDVLITPPVNGNYEGYGAKIKYSTNELSITGLKNFSVDQIDISASQLKASGVITLPAISVSSDKYSISGKALWFVPIDGSGTMFTTIRNIQLNITIQMRYNSALMWVDLSKLSFSIGGVKANLENGPTTIATLLNKSGVSIIHSYHDDIVKAVQGLMIPAIDDFLKGNDIVTPDQLFKLLNYTETPPPPPTKMRVVYLILLSVSVVLAKATPINNVDNLNGLTITQNVGDLEFYTSFLEQDSEIEDYLSEYFNTLDIKQRNAIADTITDALNGFRDVIANGNDYLPPLDPFVVDHIGPFLYTAIGVRASGDIHNLRAEGLQWFTVDHVTFNPLWLSFGIQMTIPRITITGRYGARATVFLINHNAGGNFRIFAHSIVVGVDTRLGATIRGQLFLRELDIKIDIHDTLISIEGMTGSSLINAFINSFVQSITQEVIQNELQTVSQLLSEELFDVINDFLADYSLADIRI